MQEAPEEIEEQDDDEEEDHEFIPTFTKEVGQGTISNTETLRTLFNPNETEPVSEFKLIEDSDNDIDHAKDIDVQQQEKSQETCTLWKLIPPWLKYLRIKIARISYFSLIYNRHF